ncbi:MAG: beta-ketoacyl synthase chain length factor [Campylobacteraceae bacterium]|jgi:hypothetical protein|nr:beta-ketoacyl synthase chain length factor [Campylobacteraceae bacterium]
MIISLQIMASAMIFAPEKIEDLKEKELIANMLLRRRLTRNAKMLIYLADKLGIKDERIVYGSNYGELQESLLILKNIFASIQPSPTDFQNSVYNTPSAYLSILKENRSEILCVSNGNKTGDNVMQTAAVKALDEDTIFVAVCESFALEEIDNKCNAARECAVGFKIQKSSQKPHVLFDKIKPLNNFVPSVAKLAALYECANKSVIVGVEC